MPVIIMDRCFLSNISYFFPSSLENPFFLKLAMFFEPRIYPEKIFILDVDPSTAQKRDNFQKNIDWLTKTRTTYLKSSKSPLLKKYHIAIIRDLYSIEQKTDIIANYIHHNFEKAT